MTLTLDGSSRRKQATRYDKEVDGRDGEHDTIGQKQDGEREDFFSCQPKAQCSMPDSDGNWIKRGG